MVKIVIDGIERNYADVQNAINALYKIQKEQILLKSECCHKCVYENTCGRNDIDGNCPNYKRDPPDGGYYG